MGNTLAFVVLLGWPFVVIALFRRLSVPAALCWSVIGGYMWIPEHTYINLPLLPSINKVLLPVATAAVMCMIYGAAKSRRAPHRRSRHSREGASPRTAIAYRQSQGGALFSLLIGVLIISPFLTVLTNGDPLQYGPRRISNLSIRDSISMIMNALILVLPFILGRRYLASPEAHVTLLRVLFFNGLAASVLALIEIRMSPQLNVWLYGYFAHEFHQHVRPGGFRPILFMEHGLRVGIFLAMSVLAALALWRHYKDQPKRHYYLLGAIWLLLVLLNSQNLGAAGIALALFFPALLLPRRFQILIAGVIAIGVLLYPALRNTGLVPIDPLVNLATSINPDRANSLIFRLFNEDKLLEHARNRPFFGWGGWGRSMVYDDVTGAQWSIPDGAWVIVFGTAGWAGYIAQFGLLSLPAIGLFLRAKALELSVATTGLALILAANLVDLIPNSSLTAPIWLIAGALAGRYQHTVITKADDRETSAVDHKRPGSRAYARPKRQFARS